MASTPTSVDFVNFGEFEVNLRSRELRRDGAVVRLPDQSFEVLSMLLERPGELVSRDEIRKRLWSGDTFVDFDHGLNNAVNRLRDALGDSADSPRFVGTLPRRGYRFIGPMVEAPASGGHTNPVDVQVHTLTSPGSRRHVYRRIALAATLSVLVAIVVWRTVPRRPAIHTLAVLPFQNFSGDQGQEYFADGMTDELITMLAKNRGLRVVSRTSVMRYKKIQRPLREIAHELGADGILEGSVARRGNQVHVTAQLIHVGSDTHLWAESYDRDVNDVSALQNELAQAIARQVGLSISTPAIPDKAIKSESHDAYLLGRYYWFAGDNKKSRACFQKAIALQPDYAAAWSGLADSYIGAAASGEERPKDVMPQGDEAAHRALALDDSLAEAHNTMAADYYFYRWDWKRAERESARAVELNPSYAEGHHLRGYILGTLNRTDEAIAEQKKSIELDPFARPWAVTLALIHARRFDGALTEARIRSEAQPDNSDLHYFLFDAYLHNGMEAEAAREWEVSYQVGGNKDAALAVQQAFQRKGMEGAFEWYLSNLETKSTKSYISPIEFADTFAVLKRKQEALDYLELSYGERVPWLTHIQEDANFDFLHSEPRYQAIVNKMGLQPAY